MTDLRAIVATLTHTTIRASRLSEFTNPEGVRVFHFDPEFVGTGLHECRKKIREYLVIKGHQFSFWDQPWLPHITWAFVEDQDLPLPDTEFNLEWVVREVEIWTYPPKG
jgi:2'-5' RNA ligase